MSDKGEVIIETAQRLFLEQGYDGTSVDEIAAQAGVSKTTVYAKFGDKEALFATVVRRITLRAKDILAGLQDALTARTDLETRLAEVASRLLAGILTPEVLQLRRLAVAEALRFPKIASAFWHAGPEQTVSLLSEEFARLAAEGHLRVDDPVVAAREFTYLTVGHYQDIALLDAAEAPAGTQLRAHARVVVRTFLAAHGPGAR